MTPWRTWHLMERDDGSVSLYYVKPDNSTHYVVYDTLDTPTPSLLARAEAAEADSAKWKELHGDRARDLAYEYARANAAEAEVARLQAVLADIAEDTDADNPLSYRSDDREGCLDWVYAKAKRGQDAAGG